MKNHATTSIESLEQRIAPALTSAAVSLGALTALTGGSIGGVDNNDNLGTSVSSAGDVNGDGIDDYIVGAPFAETAGIATGAAYVVFGKDAGVLLDLTASGLNGTNGFTINGAEAGARFGASVSAAGDVNGDGFGDVIIGAPLSDGNATQRGQAYIVFGHGGTFASTFSVAGLDGTKGFSVIGTNNQDFLGKSVSKAGDVNGDGFGDVIMGATQGNGDAVDSGAAYVIYGKASFAGVGKIFTSLLQAEQGFKLGGVSANDLAGQSVAGGGDINGDGLDDVIVGAPSSNQGGSNHGVAYVVFGSKNFALNTPLSGLSGAAGFRIDGVNDGDQLGSSVAIVGDLNGDGLAEIATSAPFANEGASDSGAAYVVYGKSAFSNNTLLASSLDGANGFKITGTDASQYLGSSLSGAGDVNGDGRGDLLIGASSATINGQITGAAYIVYGRSGAFAASSSTAALDGLDGLVLQGSAAASDSGISVSTAGDVNHDGFADVIVGASFAASGGVQRGAAYVVYGGLSGQADVAPNLSPDHKSATFRDIDGDLVTVKVSKGDLTNADFDLTGSTEHASFLKLQLPASFAGANVSITAKPTAAGGDGRVNLGMLDAAGVDLGKVTIAGNVERITAGNVNAAAPSVKALTVGSIGVGALPLHDTFGDTYFSTFAGKTGPITVKGDINTGTVAVSGNLAKLTLGGSLLGGDTLFSGLVQTSSGGNIGAVKIGHDLRGGAGSGSGGINSDGNIGSVVIGGSQIGDNSPGSYVFAGGNMGSVTIAHDQHNGLIRSNGALGNVTIGGSLILDQATALAGITGTKSVGAVLVKGDIAGLAAAPYQINGGGVLSGASSVAIKSLTVLGSVEHAIVLGGAVSNNGHAQIGAIRVNGDWTASSIVAGVQTAVANTNPEFFGNGDDTFMAGGPVNVIARIASITIKGEVNGSADGGDHFGFVSRQIGAVKVGALKYNLAGSATAAPFELGTTADFTVRELA